MNLTTPIHVSHPIEIHDEDGKIYRFCSQEHADVLIEKWSINVTKVTETKLPKSNKGPWYFI